MSQWCVSTTLASLNGMGRLFNYAVSGHQPTQALLEKNEPTQPPYLLTLLTDHQVERGVAPYNRWLQHGRSPGMTKLPRAVAAYPSTCHCKQDWGNKWRMPNN